MRANQWIRRFSPNSVETTLDADEEMLNSVVSLFTGAAVSAVLTSVVYHLAAGVGGIGRVLELLGDVLIPGGRSSDLAYGYLGDYGGVVMCYFLFLLGWFVANLRLPGVTVRNLPTFLVISFVLHATLAWALFFPWINLG